MRLLSPSAVRWTLLLGVWLLGIGLHAVAMPVAAAWPDVQALGFDAGPEERRPAGSLGQPTPPASAAWPHEAIADEGFDEPGARLDSMSPSAWALARVSKSGSGRGAVDARQSGLKPPSRGPPSRSRPASKQAPSPSGQQRR